MISRKPKLQRQRKIFKQEVKNFPRANQMNINVATWGRLLKRSSPGIQQNRSAQPPSPPGPQVITNLFFKYTKKKTINQSINNCLLFFLQPLQLAFETPTMLLDKPETPGETPDPQVGGLGGQRPLGVPIGGVAVLPPDTPPVLPSVPPPIAKKRVPSTPPPPPPRLDPEVSGGHFFKLFLFQHFFKFSKSGGK